MNYAYVNIVGLGFDLVGVWLVYWYAIPNLGGDVLGYGDSRRARREVWLGHAGLGCLTLGFLLQGIASGLSALASG